MSLLKPMSADAAKRLALQHGAKLEIGGKPVNSARSQIQSVAPKPIQAATPSAYMPTVPEVATPATMQAMPDPLLKEAIHAIDDYAASNFLLTESNMNLMRAVKDVLQKVTETQPAQRPNKWTFKIKRDAHGLIESIDAVAQNQGN